MKMSDYIPSKEDTLDFLIPDVVQMFLVALVVVFLVVVQVFGLMFIEDEIVAMQPTECSVEYQDNEFRTICNGKNITLSSSKDIHHVIINKAALICTVYEGEYTGLIRPECKRK